jgi:hypothetical protein
MIQRIQTIYLSIVILFSVLLFSGNMINFTDEPGRALTLTATGILNAPEGQVFAKVPNMWLLTVILILIILLSLLAILMFRNRKIQMSAAFSLIVLSVVLIAVVSCFTWQILHDYRLTVIPGIKMAMPILILIFSIIAFLNIRKDDRLVKSYDRLR